MLPWEPIDYFIHFFLLLSMTDTPPPMHFWCLTDDYSLVLIKAMIVRLVSSFNHEGGILMWNFSKIRPIAYSQSSVVMLQTIPKTLRLMRFAKKKWCLKCFFGNSVWFHGRNEADGSQSGKIDDRLLALDSTLLYRIKGRRTRDEVDFRVLMRTNFFCDIFYYWSFYQKKSKWLRRP